MNVKIAFLRGELYKTIYMMQPLEYKNVGEEIKLSLEEILVWSQTNTNIKSLIPSHYDKKNFKSSFHSFVYCENVNENFIYLSKCLFRS